MLPQTKSCRWRASRCTGRRAATAGLAFRHTPTPCTATAPILCSRPRVPRPGFFCTGTVSPQAARKALQPKQLAATALLATHVAPAAKLTHPSSGAGAHFGRRAVEQRPRGSLGLCSGAGRDSAGGRGGAEREPAEPLASPSGGAIQGARACVVGACNCMHPARFPAAPQLVRRGRGHGGCKGRKAVNPAPPPDCASRRFAASARAVR
jgi:hypothetical protein